MAAKPITIAGGGLAGLTLGVLLRRQDVPVTILEAGDYPRHRVCGEFISGTGQAILNRQGWLEALGKAGATWARTVGFFTGAHCYPVRELPRASLCVSRYVLDAFLSHEFQKIGGDLRSHHRAPESVAEQEGTVIAWGRRRQPPEGGQRLIGLKVHARNVSLGPDLEMHGARDGYVGICRLHGDEVNICGLFRQTGNQSLSRETWKARICGSEGTLLFERLKRADFIESSFCAVAGLSLRPHRAAADKSWRVGDALTMIAPVTGNGMSMAFESAALSAEPLVAYSQGAFSWEDAREKAAQACDRAFQTRLRWGQWLNRFMFSPLFSLGMCRAVLGSRMAWELIYRKTRQA